MRETDSRGLCVLSSVVQQGSCSVEFIVCNLECIVCTVTCAVSSVQFTVCRVECSVKSVHYIIQCRFVQLCICTIVQSVDRRQ